MKQTSLYLIFNHSLTPEQQEDAEGSLGATNFVPMPEDLKQLWKQVPADKGLELIDYLQPVKQWIQQASEKDYVLIQGDYGATFHLINYCQKFNLGTPVYSTTKRQTKEILQPDGSVEVVRSIKHVQFRKYQ